MQLHERQQLGVKLLPVNLTYLGPARLFQYTIISHKLCLSTNQLLSLKVQYTSSWGGFCGSI
jgi:hypothetical protein